MSILSCPWSRHLSPKPYRIGSLHPQGVQDEPLLLQRNLPYFTEDSPSAPSSWRQQASCAMMLLCKGTHTHTKGHSLFERNLAHC